jgi:hypothetical protein
MIENLWEILFQSRENSNMFEAYSESYDDLHLIQTI